MALTIYRRHSRTCSQYRKSRSARYSRACPKRCAIWVQGSLGPDYVRRSLKQTSWEAATAEVRDWEDAGRIGGRAPMPPSGGLAASTPEAMAARAPVIANLVMATPGPSTTATHGTPPISAAVEKFTASLTRQKLSHETLRKYTNLLDNRLLPWCKRQGYHTLTDLHVTEMDAFLETWTDGPLYATKNLERLRAFFRFCVHRDWMAKNPASAIKPPKVKQAPTLPFSAEEIARILAACGRYRGDRDRIRAFVLTMRYSGLRISDTVALDPTRLTGHRLLLYTSKTGEPVFMPLPPFVVAALKRIERPGQRYFSTGNAKPQTGRANWSRYLDSVFRLAAITNGHSHRFRDTFSVALLEKGVSVETVAMLLGNTPAIVQKHYSPWVKARQVALEAAVQLTWELPEAAAESTAEVPGSLACPGPVRSMPREAARAASTTDAEDTSEGGTHAVFSEPQQGRQGSGPIHRGAHDAERP